MVRGTFSPARAWRPAVVARLARTLGSARSAVQHSSRISAFRRELNSHEAASPLDSARTDAPTRLRRNAPQERREYCRSPGAVAVSAARFFDLDPQRLGQSAATRSQLALGQRRKKVSSSGRLSQALVAPFKHPSGRRLQDTVRTGRQRGAGGAGGTRPRVTMPWCSKLQRSVNTALPNPSLKRSDNGRPPGPATGYGVHFPVAGPGVLPLSPA